jgi:thiamine-phosphate pyrophosphorylase
MRPRFDHGISPGLYLITDPLLCAGHDIVGTALAAVRGGVRIVQLRDKQAGDGELIRLGRALRSALADTGALLIVNDRIEVAAAIGADGVHLGQDDAAVAEARAALGPDALIGLSTHTPAEAAAVDAGVVDYIGIGPVLATGTKPDHQTPLGFDGLAAACAASPVPAVAIGGLKPQHVAPALRAGAAGIAVVSAICAAPDPEQAARALIQAAGRERMTRRE